VGKVQFPCKNFLEPWGHLEVVFECVVEPREIILNSLMTCVYMGGSKSTPMSFNLCLKGLDPLVRSDDFFTSRKGSIHVRDFTKVMGSP
jgi:hypothetical protein